MRLIRFQMLCYDEMRMKGEEVEVGEDRGQSVF